LLLPLGALLRLAQISTWHRFNLPARSGIHRADCEGQLFDPYQVFDSYSV